MYPVFWHIGQVNFYTHGLMVTFGILVGSGIIFYLARKEKLSTKSLLDLLVFSIFAGIVGARLTYIVLYYYQFQSWYEMLLVWYGGLTSFGGITGGFLAAGLILRRKRQNVLQWFDLGMIGLLFGWAFGRIGCLLSGDTPGIVTTLKIAIWGRVPVALFEAIWSLILGGILFYLFYSKRELIKKWGDGSIFFGGLIGYALGRFVIDFWRDERILYILKGSQIFCLVIIIGVIYILFRYFKRRQNA